MINRRGFFKALAGAFVAVTVKPPLTKPIELPVTALVPTWISMANVIAFNFVANAIPEHRDYWRARYFAAIREVIKTRRGREWAMEEWE